MGIDWKMTTFRHPSFIEGRVGKVTVGEAEAGIFGEVSPLVLGLWKLENPVAAFEINMSRILEVVVVSTRLQSNISSAT
jgi:phenylalanyl-tRNA synthetase beta chain